jgi:hypothetical protein
MRSEEEYELKSEIENVEKQYAIIKDYLSGAEYDVNTVKGCLHEIKDGLSRINVLFEKQIYISLHIRKIPYFK